MRVVDDPDLIWTGSRFKTRAEPNSEPEDDTIFTGLTPVAVPTNQGMGRNCKWKREDDETPKMTLTPTYENFSIVAIMRRLSIW